LKDFKKISLQIQSKLHQRPISPKILAAQLSAEKAAELEIDEEQVPEVPDIQRCNSL